MMDELHDNLYDQVIAALKTVYDPEIPVNIYELGLVYDVKIDPESHVGITMTLTAPNCPVAEFIPLQVESHIKGVPGVQSAQVEMVFDPPWTPDRMSEAAKLELGMV
jgi:FeS assembly SUF system protein